MLHPLPLGFSIVLCTYNGQSRLEPTLKHIASLKVPLDHAIELIIVNNASTDNTELVIEKIWQDQLSNPFPMVILNEKRPGKGFAVETGYDAANLSYILTVDDDNWLDSSYLLNAVKLFEKDPNIGILQGNSIGVFDVEPPLWIEELKEFFIIGGPLKESGYFQENNFYVWGAGMVIKNKDWRYIRSIGFSALTSKLPGKAAGEDNELAIALMLLGRRAYYSDSLKYQHYMPAGRVSWIRLKQNFETFGYVNHYFFLYTLIIDAYKQEYPITKAVIWKKFLKNTFILFKRNTLRQHLTYWILPKQEYYQLIIHLYLTQVKWFFKLSNNAMQDVLFIQKWIYPLLQKTSKDMKWPLLNGKL